MPDCFATQSSRVNYGNVQVEVRAYVVFLLRVGTLRLFYFKTIFCCTIHNSISVSIDILIVVHEFLARGPLP